MTSIFRAAVPGALSSMTKRRPHEPGRQALRQTMRGALLLLLALVALLASAAPAAAAKSCGEKVIDDWFDGRIDGTYPLHCYDDAIDQLPRDVRDYSSAKDDIQRALQARLRGETPQSTETTDDGSGTAVPPSNGGGNDGNGNGNGPTGGDDPEAIPPGTPAGDDASSVPVALLLLAGLALLLLAGGAAGYAVRRYQARRVTPPAL